MILASLLLTCWILLCLMFWTQVRRLTVKEKKPISSCTERKCKTNVFLNQTYLRGCSVYPCSRKESPQIWRLWHRVLPQWPTMSKALKNECRKHGLNPWYLISHFCTAALNMVDHVPKGGPHTVSASGLPGFSSVLPMALQLKTNRTYQHSTLSHLFLSVAIHSTNGDHKNGRLRKIGSFQGKWWRN